MTPSIHPLTQEQCQAARHAARCVAGSCQRLQRWADAVGCTAPMPAVSARSASEYTTLNSPEVSRAVLCSLARDLF